jgi:hypothetical protein
MSDKLDPESGHPQGAASTTARRIAGAFGGPAVNIGPRICPVLPHLRDNSPQSASDSDESASAILEKQLASQDGDAIQYRTCSWQKTAALLFSEYICLAIMSFPWSYSHLGLVPGLLLTLLIAAIVLYTSLILWKFCLRHPEVRDVCDVGQMLFWGQKWAWYFTAIIFILNNTFIQALHVLIGAEYINTMTEADNIGGCRTVQFAAAATVICFIFSLPRTFSLMAKLATASALFTFISVLLATIFAGVQDHPAGYSAELGEPTFHVLPPKGTSFVLKMSAFLNISYTFIGQITLPSFIAEMRDPRYFSCAELLLQITD